MDTRLPGEVSEREAQVLAALGGHLSNAQIASRLRISVRTVESHVSSLLRKLGAADRRALAAMAATTDVPPDPDPVVALPTARTSFVGRDRERAAVLAALREDRLVNLVGPGGVGKTRLAAAVARQLGRTGAFVDLVPVRDGLVAPAVAAALGVVERPQLALDELIHVRLRRTSFLLVLDNCEHVLDAVAVFVDRLLAACSDVRVLTTSRETVGLGGRTLPVPPLSLVSDETGGAAGSEAVVLFLDRAAAADPAFAADPEAVRQLCARLDGMPLAIELAAARTASLGLDGLLAALGDRLLALSGGRGADSRHRSLRAVLDWSHHLLSDRESALLRRLGQFVGTFDLAAVEAVAGPADRAELADTLGRLVDKSLVVRLPAASRWRLLETIRAYALERLDESGEGAAVLARYGEWALATATALEAGAGGFESVVDDLRAAADLSIVDRGGVARALGHLLYARRFFTEACHRYTQAARSAPDSQAARDLRTAGDVAIAGARGDLGYALLQESAARACSGRERAISLAQAVAIAARGPAQFPRAVPREELDRLFADARAAAPSEDAEVEAHLAVADAWRQADDPLNLDPRRARAALDAANRAGDRVLASNALDALGSVAASQGRYREAYARCRQRLALVDELARDDPRAGLEIFDLAYMMVEAATSTGDLRTALAAAERAASDDIAGGLTHSAASKLLVPLVLMGRFDEAIAHADRMWEGWCDDGSPAAAWMAPAALVMTMLYAVRGERALAAEWRKRSHEIGGPTGGRPGWRLSTFAAFVDARVAVHTGQWLDVRALGGVPTYHSAYAVAAACELAVVSGRDSAALLDAARTAGAENDWAAACVARTEGRLGDPAALARAVAGWEAIDARFERACTLVLMPDRRREGEAELSALRAVGPA